MKKTITILTVALLSAGVLLILPLCLAQMAGPPGPWTKYTGNPVIITGTVDSWDSNSVGDPAVISDGPAYKMWYDGGDTGGIHSIGYATSTNGITWTKYAGNPVITGTIGNWDANVLNGDVVFDGIMYRMWYWGADSIPGIYAIGYATSTHGVAWTKYAGNPIITTGAASNWDSQYVLCPGVISDTGLYKMWYTGVDDGGTWSIGYVTSTNGISWTKYSGNPVLQTGPSGSWDASRVLCPEVVLDDTTYRMWYTGQDADGTRRVGYATSSDGISWTKSASNPVLGEGALDSWDANVMHVGVILQGNAYEMWYTGGQDVWHTQIGYASAAALKQIYLPVVLKSYRS